jgi:hypothetical protein
MAAENRDWGYDHQMSLANPLWGAPRIHGELLKLGIEVSQATAWIRSRILVLILGRPGLRDRHRQ